jgi:hypothetical protein
LGRVTDKLIHVIVREANTIKNNKKEIENAWGSQHQ